MLRVARLVLVGLDAGTWAAMLFFVVQAAALLLGLPFATGRLARAALPGEAAAVAHWLLAVLAVGVATGWAVDRLFRGLLAMLDTAAAGRPFARANADRLRGIATALLAVQLLDLAFAGLVARVNPLLRHPAFTWTPSVTGWLAVLLLFVLAGIFARGADMADELTGTV